jgi:carbamoyltransferase
MRILGINIGHNGSAAYVVDGELQYYIEEERLSRKKYDGNPFRAMLEASQRGVDILVIGGTSNDLPRLTWTGEDPYSAFVRKYNPDVKTLMMGHNHHMTHAATAFYNSGFESAVAVIVDGSGSFHKFDSSDGKTTFGGFETESIFDCEYPSKFVPLVKRYGTNEFINIKQPSGVDPSGNHSPEIEINNSITLTKAYEAVTDYLKFHFIEAGKTMGLAPYGKEDSLLSDLFINDRGNKNYFQPSYPAGAYIDENSNPHLLRPENFTEWHRNSSRITDIAKNLAWKVQNETQNQVGNLIEKAVAISGKTNVVIAGGYGLNCVANYYLKKRFPELNIYVEPISHDGGTSIGMAKFVHHSETNDSTIRPQKTIYLGLTVPDYSDLNNMEKVELNDVTYDDVAKLISEKNIVAIFQGRSEAGPRALGNRSILYDPRDPKGKDHVNVVKGREWFRPFAGSMLSEKFEEWFETADLKETPFMMFAIDFKLEKHGEVPSITHVDGSCRIQTVTEDQNKHYYNLIKAFDKITNIPILFNTSFNLAGDPLVETLDDALQTMKNSKIDYLYLPEIGKLLTIKRDSE